LIKKTQKESKKKSKSAFVPSKLKFVFDLNVFIFFLDYDGKETSIDTGDKRHCVASTRCFYYYRDVSVQVRPSSASVGH